MPVGPFASSVGVGRAEPEWAALNKVKTITGTDQFAEIAKSLFGDKNEAPLPLSKEVMSGDLSTAPKKVDLLIVGCGLSGAVIAERCSKELGMTSLMLDVRETATTTSRSTASVRRSTALTSSTRSSRACGTT